MKKFLLIGRQKTVLQIISFAHAYFQTDSYENFYFLSFLYVRKNKWLNKLKKIVNHLMNRMTIVKITLTKMNKCFQLLMKRKRKRNVSERQFLEWKEGIKYNNSHIIDQLKFHLNRITIVFWRTWNRQTNHWHSNKGDRKIQMLQQMYLEM